MRGSFGALERVLRRDEFADGRLNRTGLKTHHEPYFECLCESFERCDARAMLAGLDARDSGVAGAHSVGKLLLGEPDWNPCG